MIIHILDQPQMKIGDGPIGVILSPTRELAAQIHTEAKKFAKVFKMRVCAVFGGGGKWEMVKALKEAPEMVVATPGRFIELIRSKATNLSRCTMVVLDEADRMFEMGFEYQMRSIVNNIRPDRQTLLFSATMKRKVEGFARELLKDPIRIVVGTVGQANPDIRQVHYFHNCFIVCSKDIFAVS
jgi:ATP-dependent RNA helicase DDX42